MARIRHIAICTPDPEGTAEFYRKHFGFKKVEGAETEDFLAAFVTDGHINVALLHFKTDKGIEEFHVHQGLGFTGLQHIGIQVDDISETHERLKAGGVRMLTEAPGEVTGEGVFFDLKVQDPNGINIDVGTGWPGLEP